MTGTESCEARCLRGASIPVVLFAGVGLAMAVALFALASHHCTAETTQRPHVTLLGAGWHSWAILASALVLTGLLTLYFVSSIRYARRMAVLAAQLARANSRISQECAAHTRAVGETQTLQRQIEFILGATKTGLDIIDGQFNLRYVDPAWAKQYGDPTGRKCHEYFMDRDEPCPGCGIPRALETKGRVVTEETLVKEGNRRVQVNTIPFQDESGELLVAEVNVDITELASAREALLRTVEDLKGARREAEAADKAKGQFLANVSHEIRTPMNGILGFARLLLCEPLTAEQRSYAETICRSGDELLELLNNVLDLSKIEAGRVEPRLEVASLASIARSACAPFLPRAAEKGIRLSVEVDPRTPLATITDPVRLRQVLANLIGNAVKFTDKGYVTVRIEPLSSSASSVAQASRRLHSGQACPGTAPPQAGSLRNQAEPIHFAVADTGIGIPAEKLDGIFEPFVQGDGSISRHYEGTGLGLAISKGLVAILGGRLWVDTTPGRGSTFHFTIQPHQAQGPSQEPPPKPAATRNPKLETRNCPDAPLVLVVEDDPTTARLTTALLEKAGFRTAVARDGAAAVQMARSQPPLAVVLDLVLPVMDGFEVLKRLKTDPALASVPVIVCSVLPEQHKAYNLGALDYIEKPVDGELLVRKLDRLRGPLGTGGNVLVVDDDRTTLRILERALARAGYRVAAVTSGRECLAMVDAHLPVDLVVLDLTMPEMDGFAVLDALRQREATRRAPVIVNTGRDLSATDLRRLNGRYDAILNKSAADISIVISRVAELLDAARDAAKAGPPQPDEPDQCPTPILAARANDGASQQVTETHSA